MAEASQQSPLAQNFGQFLIWWKQHLGECVPAAIRARLVRARRPAMWSPTDDRYWPAASTTLDSKPFQHSALAQRGGKAALVVGENNGFRRSVELPLAVESRLHQVLSYELDRLTPLKASELYYDFRIKDRNTAAGVCTAEMVAVPRARVTPLLDTAAQRKVEVSRLLLAPADADTSLDLLATSRQSTEAAPRGSWINPALMALCGLLALALVAFPLWQMRQRVIDLAPIETAAKADAETASALQRQLERQISEYNLPLSRKHGSPLVVQVLDDLSKRLPDDTWVQSLEIRSVPNQKTREVVLQGETGSGGKILQIVQESPLIKDPTFKAAMTRVAPNAERFHIAGELVVADLPKQLQLSDSAAVTTVNVAPTPPAGSPTSPKTGSVTSAASPTAPPAAAPSTSTPATPAAPVAPPANSAASAPPAPPSAAQPPPGVDGRRGAIPVASPSGASPALPAASLPAMPPVAPAGPPVGTGSNGGQPAAEKKP